MKRLLILLVLLTCLAGSAALAKPPAPPPDCTCSVCTWNPRAQCYWREFGEVVLCIEYQVTCS